MLLIAGAGAPQTLVGGSYMTTMRSSANCDDVLFAGSGVNTFVVAPRSFGGTVTIVNFLSGRDHVNLAGMDSAFTSAQVAAAATAYSNGLNIQLPGATSGVQNIQIIGATTFNYSDFIF